MHDIAWATGLFNREIARCTNGIPSEAGIWNNLKERAARNSADPEFRAALCAIAQRRDRERLLDTLVASVKYWNPDRIAERREALHRIQELDAEIAESAVKLAKNLRTRNDIRERHGIGKSISDYNIPDTFPQLLEKYADLDQADSSLCRMHLLEELHPIIERFDLKYWPTLPDLLEIVASAAGIEDEFGIVVEDNATRRALASREASQADFIRAFFTILDDRRDIDKSWHDLKNTTLAALMNAGLNLFEEQITSDWVRKIKAEY